MLEPRPIWETSHERSIVFNGATVEPREIVFIKLYCNFRDVMKELVGAPLATFICIALHMDGKDTSFPGIRTIAKETGYAANTVQDAIDKLEKMGYIDVNRGGGRQANRYAVKRWATTQASRNVSPTDTPKQCVKQSELCISQGELCVKAIDTEVEEVDISRSSSAELYAQAAPAAAPSPKPKKAYEPEEPALKVHYSITRCKLNRAAQAKVVEAVRDLDLWARLVDYWFAGHGWSPRNIDGMLQIYRGGIIPDFKKAQETRYAQSQRRTNQLSPDVYLPDGTIDPNGGWLS